MNWSTADRDDQPRRPSLRVDPAFLLADHRHGIATPNGVALH
jgi:hypothetical protein